MAAWAGYAATRTTTTATMVWIWLNCRIFWATQPEVAEALDLSDDSLTRRKFLARLESEITKNGTIAVLRKGISHGAHHIPLFYGTPTPGNQKAAALHAKNVFSITRQLHYSNTDIRNPGYSGEKRRLQEC